MATAMVLLTVSQLSKLNYMKNISTLLGRKLSEHIDGISFVVGVITVLKQFHIEIMEIFIDEMAQYIISMADYSLPYVIITNAPLNEWSFKLNEFLSSDLLTHTFYYSLKKEIGPEAYIAVHFLFKFIECAQINREVLEKYMPEMLLNQLECLANKVNPF